MPTPEPPNPRVGRSPLLRGLLCSLAVVAAGWTQLEAQRANPGEVRNYDARDLAVQAFSAGPVPAQAAAVEALRQALPSLALSYDERFGITRTMSNRAGYLTDTDGRAPLDIATTFAQGNAVVLGLENGDVSEFEVTDVVPNLATGSTHVYLRQTVQGLGVYNAQLQVNINRDGRILSVNNQFVPDPAASINAFAPLISAPQAVVGLAAHLGTPIAALPLVTGSSPALDRATTMDGNGISLEPIQARLMFLPIRRDIVRLVWNFQIYTLDGQHIYDVTVDAETGGVWTRFDWVAADSYQVYGRPAESPNHVSPPPPADARTTVLNPANATASPFGWHDTNGAAGAEFTNPRGNNVHAYEDIDANNLPPASEPDCGSPTPNCSFPLDLTMAPSAYTAAAITNLFYWNNIVHDVQYQYGFTEAAGNFQVNNYGRGGLGGDDVRAEAQDGSGTNNANFATPPDGTPPRMQMFNWTLTTPGRDGDLDAGIIVHEYGHGISNRLVGGPSTVSCLSNTQQPGEGLSDWWTLAYTARGSAVADRSRGIGTYALGQPTTGQGIRTQRYSTDPAINTWTYASINGMAVPHGVGSVFAQAYWEVYWALVDQHGFSADLYNAAGTAGNQRAMLYLNEGLMNTACTPAFTDVRDGIVQAVMDNHGGEDYCRVWTSFATFGLGVDAVSGGPSSTAPTNGFAVPGVCVPPGGPSFSINDVTVSEGAGAANFTVSLSSASSLPTSVKYATSDATAKAFLSDQAQSNPAPIAIPNPISGSSGQANPYPSTINVPSFPDVLTKVTVTLTGFSHTFPDDVDVLLIGPGGQTVVLMSDVGGGTDAVGLNLTFDDAGPPLPDANPLNSGTFQPTNVGAGDVYPAPAPAPPHGTSLSVFNGVSPIGTWSLYINDDAGGDIGSLSGGWTLTLLSAGDYSPTSGTLLFAAGETSKPITVPIVNDAAGEPNEHFFVTLSMSANAPIADGVGVGTILNNDGGAPLPPNPNADVAIDFGALGLYVRSDDALVSWTQLHGLNPSLIAAGDLDGNGVSDLIVEFPGFGLYRWMNNTSWQFLHPFDASSIVTGDLDGNGADDAIINFVGVGLWIYYNNSTWGLLHPLESNRLVTGNMDGDAGGRDEVIIDFTGAGVYVFANNATWAQLHPANVSGLATGDLDGNGLSDVILDFPGFGPYIYYNNSTWAQLHTAATNGMVSGNLDNDAGGRDDLVINFPGFGLWARMNNTAWQLLHPFNAPLIVIGDIDGNAQDDVIVSFSGLGVWAWLNNTSWVQLHNLDPEAIVTGRIDSN